MTATIDLRCRCGDVPICPITVLSHDEREALRPLCGPRPAAS